MGFFTPKINSEVVQTPREILVAQRNLALSQIGEHEDSAKDARARVTYHEGAIAAKTKQVKDIDVALGVID